MQYLFTENYKLQRKIKEDINKWEWYADIPCSGVKRLHSVQTSILSELICRSNANPNKIPGEFLVEIDKLILQFTWNCKAPILAKTTLKNNNKVRGPTLLFSSAMEWTISLLPRLICWHPNPQCDSIRDGVLGGN